jgi:hypothetical protein
MNSTDPAHIEELAELRCGNPECADPTCSQVLVLTPVCHPQAGIYAEYHKQDGTLRTACDHCKRPVMSFKIANLPKEKMQ